MSGPSRNELCPCGSGRKYKRCCGSGLSPATTTSAAPSGAIAHAARIRLPDGRMVAPAAAIQAALQLHQSGHPLKAVELYDRVLQADPAHADALHLKGLAARQLGNFDVAVRLIQHAIKLSPNVAMYHNNLAQAWLSLNRLDAAAGACERAAALDPGLAEAHYNLGWICSRRGQLDRAASCFAQALNRRTDYVDALVALGEVLTRQGKLESAFAHFGRALALRPDSVEAHVNMGIVFAARREFDRALVHYGRALALQPDSVEARNGMGNVFARQDRWAQAAEHYGRALTLDPDSPIIHANLASALIYQREFGQALAHYERALVLQPGQVQFHSNLLQALNYVPGTDNAAFYAAHREYARRHEEPLAGSAVAHPNDHCAARRIKVGYVSSSFRQHSIAHFIEPVLKRHDHRQFEVFCYSNNAVDDAVTARLQSCVDAWRFITGRSDEDVADQIRVDRIDILVDLDGHCGTNRLPVFARKPAPVQVTWIGYPNTTGLSAMDYRITDGYADPIGVTDRFHSETLLRLPDCFSCYAPPLDAPEVGELPALNAGYVSFGSFNALVKINSGVMALWARLLKAIPDSCLVLKNRSLEEAVTQRSIQDFFANEGVPEERLILLGHSPSQVAHLEHYRRIDIGLDPFPYNGTTTTCDALWMGVPVITLAGAMHVSRVGVSQMMTLGLPQLIAGSEQEYIGIGVRLAGDLRALAELHRELRCRMSASPLADAPRLTRNLEDAYRGIWQRWCDGKGKE